MGHARVHAAKPDLSSVHLPQCPSHQRPAHGAQAQAARVFEQRQKAMDAEVNILEQQKKALGKGGRPAEEIVRQLASWQAGVPQAEQAQAHLPKGVMSFPIMKTRAASTANGFADRGGSKKKVKEDGTQADLQRMQAKNPIQVSTQSLNCGKNVHCSYSLYECVRYNIAAHSNVQLLYQESVLSLLTCATGAQGDLGQAQMAAGRV